LLCGFFDAENAVMFIESVPNRNSPPCLLLRETYRDAGKVRHRTLANLSKWPKPVVAGLRVLLKGHRDPGESASAPGQSFKIARSLPHGHVSAVLSTMRKLGLPRLLGSKACPQRDLCMAMIAARILFPGSKLAASRALGSQTLNSTLAREYGDFFRRLSVPAKLVEANQWSSKTNAKCIRVFPG